MPRARSVSEGAVPGGGKGGGGKAEVFANFVLSLCWLSSRFCGFVCCDRFPTVFYLIKGFCYYHRHKDYHHRHRHPLIHNHIHIYINFHVYIHRQYRHHYYSHHLYILAVHVVL